MTAFLIANMAPLMFASLVVFLLCGFPVAFSLAANGILFGLIGIELGLLHGALVLSSVNPPKGEHATFAPGDRLIVIAQD